MKAGESVKIELEWNFTTDAHANDWSVVAYGSKAGDNNLELTHFKKKTSSKMPYIKKQTDGQTPNPPTPPPTPSKPDPPVTPGTDTNSTGFSCDCTPDPNNPDSESLNCKCKGVNGGNCPAPPACPVCEKCPELPEPVLIEKICP